MQVTEAQMDVIREYNRIDAEYNERVQLRAELKSMKAAVRQVVDKDVVFAAEINELKQAFPGMIALAAKSMDCSVEEFNQRLQRGIVLSPKFKEALTQVLNDPFLQG